jgi:hypothetical protein
MLSVDFSSMRSIARNVTESGRFYSPMLSCLSLAAPFGHSMALNNVA